MFGHHVHKKVFEDGYLGKIKQSAVSMHFVTPEFDQGPIFFEYPILIRDEDNADKIGERVNEKERAWQSYMLNLVVHDYIKYIDEKTIGIDHRILEALLPFIPVEKVNVKIRR